MDLAFWIEALGWMAFSTVKFVVTPATAVAAGVPPLQAFLWSSLGAAMGLAAMRPLSMRLFRWFATRRRKRGKANFTPSRRRILLIKSRFGLWGVAVVGGVLGVPVAALIAYKYFGHQKQTLPVLIVVFTLWSAILTTLAASALL